MKQGDYIFLDFDETLGHTTVEYSWENAVKTVAIESTDENVEIDCFKLEGDSVCYVTQLRPGVREFLKYCRDKVGRDNVYILTSSTKDYITEINQRFDLGFENCQLISREEIYTPNDDLSSKQFEHEGRYVLVDNMSYHDHRGTYSKIGFLRGLFYGNFVKVEDYYTQYPDVVDNLEYARERIDKILID